MTLPIHRRCHSVKADLGGALKPFDLESPRPTRPKAYRFASVGDNERIQTYSKTCAQLWTQVVLKLHSPGNYLGSEHPLA